MSDSAVDGLASDNEAASHQSDSGVATSIDAATFTPHATSELSEPDAAIDGGAITPARLAPDAGTGSPTDGISDSGTDPRDSSVEALDSPTNDARRDASDGTTETETPTSDEAGSGGEDLDRDTVPDNLDWDDDDDGIDDQSDALPRVPQLLRGQLNAYPGSLMADPCVVKALAEYEVMRADDPNLPEIKLHRERQLPDLTGYYRSLLNSQVVASSTGSLWEIAGIGELKIVSRGPDLYYFAGSGPVDSDSMSGWMTAGHVQRGTTAHFSRYSRDPGWVHITSGALDVDLTQRDMVVIEIQVSVDGDYAGESCPLDAWTVFVSKEATRIDVSELAYMCVDEGTGYVPGEEWTRSDTSLCSCNSELKIACVAS